MDQTDDRPIVLIQAELIIDSIQFAIDIYGKHLSKFNSPETDTEIRLRADWQNGFLSSYRRDAELLLLAIEGQSVQNKHKKSKRSIQKRLHGLIKSTEDCTIPPSDGKDGLYMSPFASLLYIAASELTLKNEYTHSQAEMFFADLEKRCTTIFERTTDPVGEVSMKCTPKMVGLILLQRPGHVVIDNSHLVVTSTRPDVGGNQAFEGLANFHKNIVPSDIRSKLEAYNNTLRTKLPEAKMGTKTARNRYKRAKKRKMGQEKGESVRSAALTEEQTTGERLKRLKRLKADVGPLFDPQSETALHAFAFSVDQNKIRDGCFRCQCQYNLQWYGPWDDASRTVEWNVYHVKNTCCWGTVALAVKRSEVFKDWKDVPPPQDHVGS